MKINMIISSGILILLLAACSGAAPDEETATQDPGLVESYTDALPIPSQLALGSLQLDESDLEISEEQASNLLPLWQAYQSLSTSDKAAEAEIDALVKQIQGGMTPQQIETIAAMELTSEDISSYTQEFGLAMGRGMLRTSEDGEVPAPGGFGGGIPGSGMGGGPGGGGLPDGGVGGDPNARATRMAEMGVEDQEQMRAQFMSMALVGAVIQNMQIKIGEIDPNELPQGFNRGLRMAGWALEIVSEITGISLETIQSETAEGSTLADVISAHDGDLSAVETALAEAFGQMPAADNLDVNQRVTDLLNQSWIAEQESD